MTTTTAQSQASMQRLTAAWHQHSNLQGWCTQWFVASLVKCYNTGQVHHLSSLTNGQAQKYHTSFLQKWNTWTDKYQNSPSSSLTIPNSCRAAAETFSHSGDLHRTTAVKRILTLCHRL